MRSRQITAAAALFAAGCVLPSPSSAGDEYAAPPAPLASAQSAPAAPEKAPPKSVPSATLVAPRAPAVNPAAPEQAAPSQTVTLHLVAPPAPQPVVQPVTLRLTADPAPAASPPPAQAMQLQVVAAQSPPAAAVTLVPTAPAVATAPSALAGELHAAGPIRRMVGGIGDRLSRVGYDRILIPRQAQAVMVQAAPQIVVQQPTVQAVTATPQSVIAVPTSKCRWLFH